MDDVMGEPSTTESVVDNACDTNNSVSEVNVKTTSAELTDLIQNEDDEPFAPLKTRKSLKLHVLDSDDEGSGGLSADKLADGCGPSSVANTFNDSTSCKKKTNSSDGATDESDTEDVFPTGDDGASSQHSNQNSHGENDESSNQSDIEFKPRNKKKAALKTSLFISEDENSNEAGISSKKTEKESKLDEEGAQHSETISGTSWKSTLNAALYSDGDSSEGEASYSISDIKSSAKRNLKLVENNSHKSDKPSRKSSGPKKTSKEELQKIHSESQRMVRSSAVSLPYHKPKQRSLTEFLSRKRVTPGTEEHLKPRLKEYNAVVQVLEDRVKEVETFFKSESEPESETEDASEETASNEMKKEFVPADETSTSGDKTSETLPAETNEAVAPIASAAKTAVPCLEDWDDMEEDILQSKDTQTMETVEKVAEIEKIPDESKAMVEQDVSSDCGKPNSPDMNLAKKSFNEDSLDDLSSALLKEQLKMEKMKRLSAVRIGTPTLHGRPGEILDLNGDGLVEDQNKAKVNSLIERFVHQVTSCSKKKSPNKKDIQINILKKVVGPDGKLELKNDVLNVTVSDEQQGQQATANKRQILKDSLRQSISSKRAAERMKLAEVRKEDEEEVEPSEQATPDESEEEFLSDEIETEMEDADDDPIDDFSRKERKKKKKRRRNSFADEEAQDDEDDGDDEDEEDMEPASEGTVDQLGADDDSCPGGKLSLRPSLKSSQEGSSGLNPHLKGSSRFSSLEDLTPNLDASDSDTSRDNHGSDLISKLPSTQTNAESNYDELLELCSGKFTGSETEPKDEKGASRSLFGKGSGDQDDSDDELEHKGFSRIIPVADDDDEEGGDGAQLKLPVLLNDIEEEPKKAPSFLNEKKKQRKRSRLYISDEEDDDEADQSVADEEEEMHEEEREFRGLNDFFENEAELSGSEVGSGDEKEDGEDDWEEEEGDKEDIDENEVREQVERAHMKTMLDQDQREVRLFQELFLEDGDLHSDGGGRQRQFRWNNAEGADADAVNPKSQQEDDEAAEEDQDDFTWRKLRNEREKWLQQQKSLPESEPDAPLLMKRIGKTIKVNTISKPKAVPAGSDKAEAPVPPLAAPSSPPPKNKRNMMVARGSFLRRNEKDLSAIASLSKSMQPVQVPKNGSNFVFASITPERPTAVAQRKHKQEESKEESSKQKLPPTKKARTSLNSKSIFSYF